MSPRAQQSHRKVLASFDPPAPSPSPSLRRDRASLFVVQPRHALLASPRLRPPSHELPQAVDESPEASRGLGRLRLAHLRRAPPRRPPNPRADALRRGPRTGKQPTPSTVPVDAPTPRPLPDLPNHRGVRFPTRSRRPRTRARGRRRRVLGVCEPRVRVRAERAERIRDAADGGEERTRRDARVKRQRGAHDRGDRGGDRRRRRVGSGSRGRRAPGPGPARRRQRRERGEPRVE